MEKNELEIIADKLSDLTEQVASLSNFILAQTNNKEPPEIPYRLDSKQAIEFIRNLGIPISKSKLYKLTSTDNIPRMYVGNRMVFEPEQLKKWCNQIVAPKINNINAASVIASAAQNKLTFKTKKLCQKIK